jgi:hypothetical protein
VKQKYNSGVYAHTLAPFSRVNGGAEEFAFVMPTTLPLISFRGPARLAGQFNPFQPNPIISLNPIGAPQGLPFVNSDFYNQESQNQNSNGGVDPIGPEQPFES